MNNEKTVSNLLKTNSSFHTKTRGCDTNDVRMTNSPIDKAKSLSQNLMKKDTIKSNASNALNNKVSSQIKGIIDEKYKIMSKSIHGYNHIPKYIINKLSSIDLERYKNNIIDKLINIKNTNETNDTEKKGVKERIYNNKSFSKNKK